MTAKEYLLQARTAQRQADRIRRQIEDLRAVLDGVRGIDYSRDKVLSGADPAARRDALLDRIVKLEVRWLSEQNSALDRLEDVKAVISAVQNPAYRELLELRYLQGIKLERVADVMGYSFDHVRHMHGWALLDVKTILELKT